MAAGLYDSIYSTKVYNYTTPTNATSAIKSYMGTVTYYWLRLIYQGFSDCFYYITSDGKDYGGDIIPGVESLGISPVFRIG